MQFDALTDPDWSSFLLSLGSDVAVSVALPGQSVPSTPNMLQLHRATTQENWPKSMDGQSLLPPPAVLANDRLGSRIYIRQAYRWMSAELPLAKQECQAAAQGVAVCGNDGIGKVRLTLH